MQLLTRSADIDDVIELNADVSSVAVKKDCRARG